MIGDDGRMMVPGSRETARDAIVGRLGLEGSRRYPHDVVRSSPYSVAFCAPGVGA